MYQEPNKVRVTLTLSQGYPNTLYTNIMSNAAQIHLKYHFIINEA